MTLDIHKPLTGDSSVPEYFKYSSLVGERLAWFEGMVLRGEFHFSHPVELNDPFECRPHFVPPPGHPELVKFKLRRFLRQKGLAREMRRGSYRSVAEIAQLMTRLWRAPGGEANQIQLFCMSTVRTDPLLWAHYANGHRGACVHIDPHYVPFASAVEVDYSDEYASIPLIDLPPPDEVFRRLVRVKATPWKYEHEYRVVRHLRSPSASLEVDWKGQLALASPNAISGVTLGARIDPADEAAVRRMVSSRARPVPVWKAQPEDGRFAFTFERIA